MSWKVSLGESLQRRGERRRRAVTDADLDGDRFCQAADERQRCYEIMQPEPSSAQRIACPGRRVHPFYNHSKGP